MINKAKAKKVVLLNTEIRRRTCSFIVRNRTKYFDILTKHIIEILRSTTYNGAVKNAFGWPRGACRADRSQSKDSYESFICFPYWLVTTFPYSFPSQCKCKERYTCIHG